MANRVSVSSSFIWQTPFDVDCLWRLKLDEVTFHLALNIQGRLKSTVWFRYNLVNFLENIHKRHSIARPLGRANEGEWPRWS